MVTKKIIHAAEMVCPQWAPIAQPIISNATVKTTAANGLPKQIVTFTDGYLSVGQEHLSQATFRNTTGTVQADPV